MKILRSHEYKRLLRARDHLSRILDSVCAALSENDRFHYQYNEPGSGDVHYITDGDVDYTRDGVEHCNERNIEFNQYTSEFNGFYIDDRKVPISEVIKLLNLP